MTHIPQLPHFLETATSPTKEHLFKTATIRMDIGFDHINQMRPGEIVAVKYWKHEFDATTNMFRPVYLIAKTQDMARHFEEGTFATVFNSALEKFVL